MESFVLVYTLYKAWTISKSSFSFVSISFVHSLEFLCSIFEQVWFGKKCFKCLQPGLRKHFWFLCINSFQNQNTGFDLTSHDLWFLTRFRIFTTEFFVIISFFMAKKIKINGNILMVNYVNCVPFSWIDSFHIIHNQAN